MTNSANSDNVGPTPSSNTPADAGADLRIKLALDDEARFREDLRAWLRVMTRTGHLTPAGFLAEEANAYALWRRAEALKLPPNLRLMLLWPGLAVLDRVSENGTLRAYEDRHGLLHQFREYTPPHPSPGVTRTVPPLGPRLQLPAHIGIDDRIHALEMIEFEDILDAGYRIGLARATEYYGVFLAQERRRLLEQLLDALGCDKPSPNIPDTDLLNTLLGGITSLVRQRDGEAGWASPGNAEETMSHEPPNPFDPHSPENIALDIQLGLRRDPEAPADPSKDLVVRCPVCSTLVALRDGLRSQGHELAFTLSADHTRADVYVRVCPGKTTARQRC